jgi:hypothetical protein
VSINIEAPIVPGISAAGIQLGSPIEDLLNEHKNSLDSGEVVNLSPSFPLNIRYRSAMVDVWAIEGRVEQIMVHNGYRGKLMGKIGLASTFADIERHIGSWDEDEEDNLVIGGIPGVFFRVEGYFPDLKARHFALPLLKRYTSLTSPRCHLDEKGARGYASRLPFPHKKW